MRKGAGFTLVEILIVVVVIVTVAAFGVPAYKKAQTRSAYMGAKGVLMQIGGALDAFRADLRTYNKAGASSVDMTGRVNYAAQEAAFVTSKTYFNRQFTDDQDPFMIGFYSWPANLFGRGYLEPLFPSATGSAKHASTYNGYGFYICPTVSGSSTACCVNKPSGAIACMRLEGSGCSTSNYPGAFYYEGGIVEDATDVCYNWTGPLD